MRAGTSNHQRKASQQTASQQQPADRQQQTHGEQDKSMAAPQTGPLRETGEREYRLTSVSGRPLTRQHVDQGGQQQKRKRRDLQCVMPYRSRTRQRIAERETCDSKPTKRRVRCKLTRCGPDAGVPFDVMQRSVWTPTRPISSLTPHGRSHFDAGQCNTDAQVVSACEPGVTYMWSITQHASSGSAAVDWPALARV